MWSQSVPCAVALLTYAEIQGARRTLPLAGERQPRRILVEVNSEDAGRVLVTFELLPFTVGPRRYWMWGVHSAFAGPGAGQARCAGA